MSMARKRAQDVKTRMLKNMLKLVSWEKQILEEEVWETDEEDETDITRVDRRALDSTITTNQPQQNNVPEKSADDLWAQMLGSVDTAEQDTDEKCTPALRKKRRKKRLYVQQRNDFDVTEIAHWKLLPELTEEMLQWKSTYQRWEP